MSEQELAWLEAITSALGGHWEFRRVGDGVTFAQWADTITAIAHVDGYWHARVPGKVVVEETLKAAIQEVAAWRQ